jgi:hypothetical protein
MPKQFKLTKDFIAEHSEALDRPWLKGAHKVGQICPWITVASAWMKTKHPTTPSMPWVAMPDPDHPNLIVIKILVWGFYVDTYILDFG